MALRFLRHLLPEGFLFGAIAMAAVVLMVQMRLDRARLGSVLLFVVVGLLAVIAVLYGHADQSGCTYDGCG